MKQEVKSKADILSRIYHDLPSSLTEDDIERLQNIVAEFARGFSLMMGKGPFVTVFGSSRTGPDEPEYRMGMELGAALAKEGYSVLTGGGPGVMEAVNRGAHEANGRSVGINIFLPDEQRVNPYVEQVITMDHFFVRKVLLLRYSRAFIYLPGGFGTLDELFETVTLVQTRKISPFPVILMQKDFWEGLLGWINGTIAPQGLIAPADINYIHLSDSVDEAIGIIRNSAVVE